jgi:hypothetical protein
VTTKFTFKQEYPGFSGMNYSSPPATVSVEVSGDLSVQQLLEKFEDFLRGAGYVFNGHIVIEEEEDTPSVSFGGSMDDNVTFFTDDSINLTGAAAGETYVVTDSEHSSFYYDTERNKPVKV